MSLDVKNFYLNTQMTRYEYVQIKIDNEPGEIIKQYNLREKMDKDGYLYIEVQKGMYGLPQAGILAQELLEQLLNKHGYFQNKFIPGFWMHQTRPISFTLVVDDFRIKYLGREHVMHLISLYYKRLKCRRHRRRCRCRCRCRRCRRRRRRRRCVP